MTVMTTVRGSLGGPWRDVTQVGPLGPWHILAAVSASAALMLSTTTFKDPDLYWHVEAGRQILQQRSLVGIGASWSYAHHNASWVTTQWLSECVLAGVHTLAGWRGVMELRLLLSAIFVLGLTQLLLRGRAGSVWAPLVFSMTLLTTAPSLQERPQLISFVFLLWLARWAAAVSIDGRIPRTGPLLALTWLWANLHGLWILVPTVLLLLAAGAALEHQARRPWTKTKMLAGQAVGCLAVAALTPAGPSALTAPIRLHSATAFISEWQPTTPWNALLFGFDLTVALLVLGWARASGVPRSEMLYAAALVGFGLTAFRNVVPALLLLSPIALHRIESSMPRRSLTGSSRERRLLAGALVAILAVGVLGASFRALTATIIDSQIPVRLAKIVASDDGRHRVLNDYNVGGTLIHWGGGRVQVGIDGRADYYGGDYVRKYLELISLKPGWSDRLRALRPDRALLSADAPLIAALLQRGWKEMARDHYYILLKSG